VHTGILDPNAIEACATKLNQQVSLQKQSGSFEKAWRPFHDSFDDNLPEVVDSLVNGAKRNLEAVSLAHLNEAVRILRAFGRQHEAEEVLDFFVANKPSTFWEKGSAFFRLGSYEPDIDALIQREADANQQVFVPDVDLIEAGRTYDPEKIKKMASVPVDEYYRILKSKKGNELTTFVLSALEFRRISNASDDMREVIRRMEAALKRVGSESSLNAIRVRKFGIEVTE
jgi:hypothetical protein